MRRALALFALVLPLAGCAAGPGGEAEAAHQGVACPVGQLVAGFDADGAPDCAPPGALASFSCPPGEAVVGFDAEGAPQCGRPWASMPEAPPTPVPTSPTATTPAPRATIALTLTSAGAVNEATVPGSFLKRYAVSAASEGATYGDLKVLLDGEPRPGPADACVPATDGSWSACAGGVPRKGSDAILAGDGFTLREAATPVGRTLQLIDVQANAVILTLTIAS